MCSLNLILDTNQTIYERKWIDFNNGNSKDVVSGCEASHIRSLKFNLYILLVAFSNLNLSQKKCAVET
jgi:hypothetical protein